MRIGTHPILHSHRLDIEPSSTATWYHSSDQCLTDLVYADDAVIFLSDEDQAADCFSALSNAAAPFGLRMSWTKTKVQNLGCVLPSSSLTVEGEIVEGVEEFVYLGSKQTSDGYCRPETMSRIGLASAVAEKGVE